MSILLTETKEEFAARAEKFSLRTKMNLFDRFYQLHKYVTEKLWEHEGTLEEKIVIANEKCFSWMGKFESDTLKGIVRHWEFVEKISKECPYVIVTVSGFEDKEEKIPFEDCFTRKSYRVAMSTEIDRRLRWDYANIHKLEHVIIDQQERTF